MQIKRKLSSEAIEALDYAYKNHDCVEWVALDGFRVWYRKPYVDEDGCAGIEIISKEFVVKEVA